MLKKEFAIVENICRGAIVDEIASVQDNGPAA
jgi:hypothetical protein